MNQVSSLHIHEERLGHIQAGAWASIAECAATARHHQTGDGSRHAIQRLRIDPDPAGGSFSLQIGEVTTGDLAVHISALGLRDVLRKTAGTDTLVVRKIGLYEWEIEWLTPGPKDLLIVDDRGLVCHRGIRGTITWNEPLLNMLAMSGPDGIEAEAELTLTELATGCELKTDREPVTIHQSLT